jgi:guanylate kinase
MMAGRRLPFILAGKTRKRGRLFVVSGPSGCGKTTLCGRLLKEDKGLVRSISVTTRKPRGKEQHNRDYIYTSKAKFKRMLQKGMFLEYARVFGNYYATPKGFIDNTIKSGKDVLLNIDVQGAAQVKKKLKSAVLVFIVPPSMRVLKKRLIGRLTDSEMQVQKRLGIAVKELRAIDKYDYYVVNDKLKTAADELKHIIISARKKHKVGGEIGQDKNKLRIAL